MKLASTFPILILAFLLAPLTIGRAQLVYQVTNLGTLPGQSGSVARGLNNNGHVVGWSGQKAFFWSPETGMVELALYAGRTFHAAYDLNDSDIVVGSSGLEVSGPNALKAVRWIRPDTVENLGTLGTGYFSAAYGVNDSDWVVGYSYTNGGSFVGVHPFLWTPTAGMTSLTPGSTGQGYAHDINDAGQVTGYNNVRAFVWSAGNGFLDLGVPSGWYGSWGYGINSNGVVCGGITSASGNSERFVRWNPDTQWQILGGAGEHNSMWGINSTGTCVGAQGSPSVGFIFVDSLGLHNLDDFIPDTTGWHIMGAFDINDAGQIAGYAFNTINGYTRAVLLTPDLPPPPVTDLTAVVAGDGIMLKWTPVPGADQYLVYGSPDPEFTPGPEFFLFTTAETENLVPINSDRLFYRVVAQRL